MRGDSGVQAVGVLLGVSAFALTTPIVGASPWWVPVVVTAGVAAVGAYVVAHGVNRIPGASPRAVAGLTTVLIGVVAVAAVGVLGERLDSSLQPVVAVVGAFALFRVVVVTVDRFTPSFTVSLIGGLTASVSFAAAAPLLAFGHDGLSAWACLGLAAGIGFGEGVLVGVLLRPLFAAA